MQKAAIFESLAAWIDASLLKSRHSLLQLIRRIRIVQSTRELERQNSWSERSNNNDYTQNFGGIHKTKTIEKIIASTEKKSQLNSCQTPVHSYTGDNIEAL